MLTCGYSPLGILLTALLASVGMLGGAVALGCWLRLAPGGVPLVGS